MQEKVKGMQQLVHTYVHTLIATTKLVMSVMILKICSQKMVVLEKKFRRDITYSKCQKLETKIIHEHVSFL
jgi:hypothetical protein